MYRKGLCMVQRSQLHQTPGIFCLVMLLSLALVVESIEKEVVIGRREVDINGRLLFSKENATVFARKLLQTADDNGDRNRIGAQCTKDDIVIFQGSTAPLPNGIPAYTVQILNTCVSGSISNIHVSCGGFTSVRLVNPRVFRRVCYDDCLVNDGQPLGPGQTLSFQYANSFEYPLSVSSVSSVSCC